jgi:uncharacterized protein (DUF1499 family)
MKRTTILPLLAACALGCAAAKPVRLGIVDGKLAECPASPNCVSSQAADDRHHVEPFPVRTTTEEAMKRLGEIVRGMPRSRVISEGPGYLRAEFTSRIFRWVDDVEAVADAETKLIHVRSSSRTGYSDLGVNRSRIEAIRERYSAIP